MKKLRKIPDSDIKHEGASLHAEAKVDQGLKGQGGHMRLAPLTLLCVQVLLILDPPVQVLLYRSYNDAMCIKLKNKLTKLLNY